MQSPPAATRRNRRGSPGVEEGVRRGRSRRVAVIGVALVALGAAAAPVGAQDDPTASVEEDTTWTRSQSPVVVPRFVTVQEGVTLTIEPGVRVETRGLRVQGAVRAVGTSAEPIVFTGVDGGTWDGITIDDVAGERPSSALSDARIENADTGLSMRKDAFPVEDTVFTGNRTALSVTNPATAVSFTGNELYSNRYAFVGKTTGFVGLYGNDFWDNQVSLLFEAQSPYACGNDPGLFDARYNDILRGPHTPYWSYDVHTSAESRGSGMVVRAPENWWGTTDEEDIAARMRTQGGCCHETPIQWQEPATEPQTPAEPPGPVGTPEYELPYHGDPGSTVGISRPRHRDCLPDRSLERIAGSASHALMRPPRRIDVALVRVREGSGCESYDPATGRFSIYHSCGDRVPFKVPVRDGDWHVDLRRPLGSGKYTLAAGGNGGSTTEIIRFRVLRS